MRTILLALSLFVPLTGALAAQPILMTAGAEIPADKATSNGKYLSSVEAHEHLLRSPATLFIDVRDPLEIALTGRPEPVDAIVPYLIQSTHFDETLGEYRLVDNPDFLAQIEDTIFEFAQTRDAMIILSCGSGRRSAQAAEILIKAGFSNVWHITDGYEGDTKPGMNEHNAWQLAGLPWSRSLVFGSEWSLLAD